MDLFAAALVDVEAPGARLRFAAAHKFKCYIKRIVESLVAIGQIDAAPVLDRAIPVPKFEGIDRHRQFPCAFNWLVGGAPSFSQYCPNT
jgi:hypothetical protein